MKKLGCIFTTVLFLCLLSPVPQATAAGDLRSDREALLDFGSSVPHSRRLNWTSSNDGPCTSWIGITCRRLNDNQLRVVAVRLPAVGLYGPFPGDTISKLDALITLSLRSNHLTGDLPSDVLSLPPLRHIYFQHNNFSGHIPSSFSPNLVALDLSSNSLTGAIPSSLQNSTKLRTLKLQHNALTGALPSGLNVTKLKHLNVSYNQLNGPIPSSLQSYPASSFVGNDELCGPPIKKQCPNFTPSPAPSPRNRKRVKKSKKKKLGRGWVISIAIAVTSFVGFFVAIVGSAWWLMKKNGEEGERSTVTPSSETTSVVQETPVFFHGYAQRFVVADLLGAEAEVLGEGCYGTSHKTLLEDGTAVVVKRVNELAVGNREFELQMEIIGKLELHQNVMPLRAYYCSEAVKLMVYDYLPAGCLSSLFQGNNRSEVEWDARWEICIGAARGIAKIHAAGLLCGNIKPSNVLMRSGGQVYISDYGLATMMNDPADPTTTAAYRAPELVSARECTQGSDVYSFGVLMLEVLTGKEAVDLDLPGWVQSVARAEWPAEVFDPEVTRFMNVEREMAEMLDIALACVANFPETRPPMAETMQMISKVRPQLRLFAPLYNSPASSSSSNPSPSAASTSQG